MKFLEEYSDLLGQVPLLSQKGLTSVVFGGTEKGRKLIIATYAAPSGTLMVAVGKDVSLEEKKVGFEFFDERDFRKVVSKEDYEYVLASDDENTLQSFQEPDNYLSIDKIKQIFDNLQEIVPEKHEGWNLNVLELSKLRNSIIIQASYLDPNLEEFIAYFIRPSEEIQVEDAIAASKLERESLIELKEGLYIAVQGDLEEGERDKYIEEVKNKA